MDWQIWLAFGLGLFVGANLGVLFIGLLVGSREDRASDLVRPTARREIKDSLNFKRREYYETN